MNFHTLLDKLSITNKNLYYKLIIIFSLFFLVPVIVVLYFAFKYNISKDEYFAPLLIVFLIFSFIGFRFLRKLFDHIKNISTSLSKTAAEETAHKPLEEVADELSIIVQSFKALEDELKNKVNDLEKKTAELDALKELYDLSYMTFNPDYLLFIILERALKLVNADVGSVMILSRPQRDTFTIKANIGLNDYGKKGTITFFDDSIAKFTVINKAPLLVENIETDRRFARRSRSQYSTKSFVCMPLRTSNDVIGVVTVSRRQSQEIFSQADVDILTPLLGNTAFIYDNLNLLRERDVLSKSMKSLGTISKAINSSLKGGELLQVIFQQIRKNIPYDVIVLFACNKIMPEKISIVDFKAFIPVALSRGESFSCKESILGKAIKEQRSIFLDDFQDLTSFVDRKLFHQRGVQTALIVPLKIEDQVTNFVLLYNVEEKARHTLTDIIDVMSDQLLQAVEKDRIVNSLAKRDWELDSLSTISNGMAKSTFSMEKILAYAIDMVRIIIPAEAGYLMLRKDDGLSVATAFQLDMQKLKEIQLQKGEGIAGYVFDRGLPMIVNDARQHPHFSPVIDQKTGFYTQSVLSAPLISSGQAIGVIELLNKPEGGFNPADQKLLQSVATSVSIALENARNYREIVSIAENERDIRHAFQQYVPADIVDKITS